MTRRQREPKGHYNRRLSLGLGLNEFARQLDTEAQGLR